MTDGAAAREITPLEERLIALIKSRGPITVADYMEDALLHPHDGYYTSQAPIGAKGDFTTAPEISQIFGGSIGLWLVQSWTDMGSPKDFNLVELGPGRGVLMQDILRAARLRPAFLDAAHVWLVETSGRLRHEQQRRLRDAGIATDWADAFADIPSAPSLIIANEFFDCLPIRQFVRSERGWRERLVGLNAELDALAFCESPTPPLPTHSLPETGKLSAARFSKSAKRPRVSSRKSQNLLSKTAGARSSSITAICTPAPAKRCRLSVVTNIGLCFLRRAGPTLRRM